MALRVFIPPHVGPRRAKLALSYPSLAKRGEGGAKRRVGGGSAGEEFAQGNALFTPTRLASGQPPKSELRSY